MRAGTIGEAGRRSCCGVKDEGSFFKRYALTVVDLSITKEEGFCEGDASPPVEQPNGCLGG